MMRFFFIFFLLSCSRTQNFESVKNNHPSSFQEITDRHGELIHEIRRNHNVQRRAWTKLSELPPKMLEEILIFEDHRFYSHFGFDPLAMLNSLKSWPLRGASTISMQTTNLLLGVPHKRSVKNKIYQILSSLKLEVSWSKKEILETYFNLVTFKGELQGINAASLGLFGKYPRGLDLYERILLYSMIPSPNQKPEKILSRACRYLKRISSNEDCRLLQVALDLSFYKDTRTELQQNLIPHLATKLKNQNEVQTTIIKSLQIEAQKTLSAQIRFLQHQNVTDGAILIIDRKTAQVLAYVGSSGAFSHSRQVDHIQSLRQAGSTLKPFLFAKAISKKIITMNTPLRDEPFTVTKDGLTYRPENYQKSFTHQDIPAKIALGSSLNIPAIRVIDLLGPERFYHFLADLEMRHLLAQENYGHSMALGAVDITLWDLVRGYRAMAEGNLRELSYLPENKFSQKIIPEFSAEVRFIMGSILSEKENRHLTFGLQSSLSTDSWSAVKTGTSKDMRDNWCVGYTDRFVIGIWIGNSSGESMWNVTGISGAAPIFSHLVSYLHQEKRSSNPIKPNSLIEHNQNFYIPGTEPKYSFSIIKKSEISKIIFPQDGSQFAFDPEIPEFNQRIHFKKSSDRGELKMFGKTLSLKELGRGFLPEKKGSYRIELWEDEMLKDSITFHVKAGKYL